MSLADTLRLALNNLRQAKLRTGLTSLGVAIGIAALIGMVSLGVGLQDQLLSRFMQSGVFDAITVTPSFGRGAAGILGARGRMPGARGGGRGGAAARHGPTRRRNSTMTRSRS
jgi:putative ABC transport system permease protein